MLLWNYYQIPLDALEDTRIVYWNKFGRPELPDEMYVAPFPGRMVVRRRESGPHRGPAQLLGRALIGAGLLMLEE